MKKTTEYKSSVIELVRKAKRHNSNIGNYVEHYINEDFNYSVRLDNGYAVKVSRILAQDYDALPSILNIDDLKRIANSVWKIKSE